MCNPQKQIHTILLLYKYGNIIISTLSKNICNIQTSSTKSTKRHMSALLHKNYDEMYYRKKESNVSYAHTHLSCLAERQVMFDFLVNVLLYIYEEFKFKNWYMSIFINLRYLRLKLLKNNENNKKICHIFHHNFLYLMMDLTLKLAFIGFWIQTLHMLQGPTNQLKI